MEGLFTLGLPAALAAKSLGLCFVGACVGMLLGASLGIGPIAAVILSFSFSSNLHDAIALLGGLFFGAQYGRSISAILLGIPGGASAIVTTRDGHPLAEQGQAGRALTVTLFASLVASTIATVSIAVLAVPLSGIALWLGPTEYVALFTLSLTLAIAVAGGAAPKALVMVVLGLLLAFVATGLEGGETQHSIALNALKESLNGYVVTIGLIVFSAVIGRFNAASSHEVASQTLRPFTHIWSDLRTTAWPVLRGSVIGTLLGLLPVGALVAPFLAYRVERSLAEEPSRFGNGAIEGVAAPEAANNAGALAALLPFLTLGLPLDAVMTTLLGALTVFNAVPGPQLQPSAPAVFWGTIAAFWVGCVMVLLVGLGSVNAWVALLSLPRRLLLGALIVLGCIWTYSINASSVDVLLAVMLGLVGYALAQHGFEPLPLVIGFLLGPQLQAHFDQVMMISRGSLLPFVHRPLTAGLLLAGLVVLVMGFWSSFRRVRDSELTGP